MSIYIKREQSSVLFRICFSFFLVLFILTSFIGHHVFLFPSIFHPSLTFIVD
ncbi:Protein CBG26007 [Caenorhabditis briggsae]|uniref:Protein CBG26007 n=1 Tax=Caenorhabditis briggsae TaxID=6238 RepID=B6IKV7_CAEBR|nr:Protein CBG26007 [Caenorhabditis briggsae]CAS00537.1 Protein CBG26007 [Caenorhabditis briggsae]